MKDKEIGKIYETKNYAKFKRYEWNRVLNQNTMNKLDKSVQENGWKVEPIIVNEEMGIIDGQHRYTYAMNNGYSVYYMVIPGLTSEDCQMMNSVRTSWLTTDYIRYYAVQGNTSYVRLMSLNETYRTIGMTSITYAVVGGHSAGNFNKKIINGKFECTDEEYEQAIEILDYLSNLIPTIKKIRGKRLSLCNAIIFCYKSGIVDMERLANQIENFSNDINGITDMESALRELENIYNRNVKKKEKRVYLVTEWKKGK